MTEERLVPNQELILQVDQNGSNVQKKENHQFNVPADGGSRAWAVMLGSFFCNGILFGVINSYGVLYSEFHDNLQRKNVSNAAGKAGNFFKIQHKELIFRNMVNKLMLQKCILSYTSICDNTFILFFKKF